MRDFAIGPAILMLLGGLLLWFNPKRALAMLHVNYVDAPVGHSMWYRVGSAAMLLMAFILFIIIFVPE